MLKNKYSKYGRTQGDKIYFQGVSAIKLSLFFISQRQAITAFLSLSEPQYSHSFLNYYHREIVDCYKCNVLFKLDANQKN